mmetsp:Transcript_13005/g.41573  ORF Transcript_13005/g.41573 Transcript_13005/m.41573 type:complete len:266 (+) Transcript_13005:29-826(+)
MALAKAQQLAQELKGLVESEPAPCTAATALLRQLRVALIEFPSLPPAPQASSDAQAERMLARSVFELALLLAVKTRDSRGVDKAYAQLHPFYTEFSDELGPSPLRWPVVALYLMHLLVESRLAEFHSEVELIPADAKSDSCLQFVLGLEAELMQGSYNKIWERRRAQPNPYFAHSMESLVEAVREEVADCAERAYPKINEREAVRMLLFESVDELRTYVESREGWALRDDGFLHFPSETETKQTVPAERLVRQTLAYATELERIV